MTKKEAHLEYLRRWTARGGETRKFKCPWCKEAIERTVPKDPGEVWTTAMECPECGEHAFVRVPHRGRISAKAIPVERGHE